MANNVDPFASYGSVILDVRPVEPATTTSTSTTTSAPGEAPATTAP